MKMGLEILNNNLPYDSTNDTKAHIELVKKHCARLVDILTKQVDNHDASKLESPEKEAFDIATPKLRGLTYGSDDYRASLREIKPAIDHHYADPRNLHHPEHYENGIYGMNIISLMELLCDFCAATERHDNGNIKTSILKNADRFYFGDVLTSILMNTVLEFNMGKGVNEIPATENKPGLVTFEDVAKVCYEANRAFCESQGDNSFLPWDKAEEWQKITNINGVKFKFENPDTTPDKLHENWLKEKEADGWKYGVVKDAEKKEHPCMVPYNQLPEVQKIKDKLLNNIIVSFINAMK